MTDVRLTALNPVDSQVYPVACNTSGELLVAQDTDPDLTVTGDLTVDGTASFSNDDVSIDSSGKVNVNSGFITLNGNKLGAIKVTIADNAFVTITPPRVGAGYITIVEGADEPFPNASINGMVYGDWGTSPFGTIINANSKFELNNGGPPDGTTGNVGNATLFLGGTSGTIYLENRTGSTGIFFINFI